MTDVDVFHLVASVTPLAVWAGFGLHQLRIALRSREWPATSGQIVISTYAKPRRITWLARTPFLARVQYRYEVRGQSYLGKTIGGPAGEDTNFEDIGELLEAFPVGRSVPVYYDPSRPGRSVLRHGAGFSAWLVPVIPILGLVGLYAFWARHVFAT